MRTDRPTLRAIRRTSAFRLIAALSLVYTIGLAALAAAIYTRTAQELTQRSDGIVQRAADRLAATPAESLADAVDARTRQSDLVFAALIDPDGETVAGNILVEGKLPLGRPVELTRRPAMLPIRVVALRHPSGATIVVARDISQLLDLRRSMLAIVIGSWAVVLVVMAAAAVALGTAPLRRVRTLQQAADEIAAGHFWVRMPIAGRHDELDQFAATVNVMVEEMERVVAQVKGVTDAIAHDLRTPLAHARAHLRRAEERPAIPPDLAALVGQAGAEIDSVLARFAALLRIAQIEASGRRTGFGAVDLVTLVEDLAALYEPLAEERGVALTATVAAVSPVDADPQLLFEALGNLVDNAVKFAESRVTIALVEEAGAPSVIVTDDGPGIAADERDAVLRRFHRGAAAAGTPGSGLGLSVVAAIVHLHGFAVFLESAAPGLRARLVMAAPE